MGGIDDLQKVGTIMISLMENARLHHTAASYTDQILNYYRVLQGTASRSSGTYFVFSVCHDEFVPV